jgi:hypothetical protein
LSKGREILLEQENVKFFSGIIIDENPSSFDEAWNHDDPKARGKWRDAIKKELCNMDKQQVWEIILKEDIPEYRRSIKCKLIFKISETEFSEQDWWLVDIVEFLESTSMKALLR